MGSCLEKPPFNDCHEEKKKKKDFFFTNITLYFHVSVDLVLAFLI